MTRQIARKNSDDTGLDELNIEDLEVRDATHFRRIIQARHAVDDAESRLREAVAEAKEAGDSWAMIGAALGTSRQNAYQRFGKG